MSDQESDSGATSGGGPDAPPIGAGPSGPPPNIQQLVASKRLQQAQAQVGEVVDIMRVNVEKVLERDQKISELDRRADDLQEGASQFQQHAVKLKRKYWWENIKMWIIIGVILLMIVIIVVVTTTQNQDQIKENVNVGSENVHKEGPGSTPNSGPGEKVPEDMSSGSSSGGTGNSNESVKPYAG